MLSRTFVLIDVREIKGNQIYKEIKKDINTTSNMLITESNTIKRIKRHHFVLNTRSSELNEPSMLTLDADDDSIKLIHFIAYKIIAPIIISTGLFGNVLTILILKNQAFRGVMHNFFLALTLFDLFSLVFSISGIIHILEETTTFYTIALWYSYCETLFINSTMGTSVLIIVYITFDRYMSACHPYVFNTIHNPSFCKLGILSAFLIAFVVWLPTSFLKTPTLLENCKITQASTSNSTLWVACQRYEYMEYTWYVFYAWTREVIISFFPILIVIVLNGFLLKYFLEKRNHQAINTSRTITSISYSKATQQGDKNLSDLLRAIIICFLVTILPAGIFNGIYSEKLENFIRYELFRAIANNLELLNHSLNFYLYVLLCKPIRTALPSMVESLKSSVARKLEFPNRKICTISGEMANIKPKLAEKVQKPDKQNSLVVTENICRSDSTQTHFSDLPNECPQQDGLSTVFIQN